MTEKYVIFIEKFLDNISLDSSSNKIYKFNDIFTEACSDLTSHQKFTYQMKNYMVILRKTRNNYKVIEGPIDTRDFLLIRPDKIKWKYIKYWNKTCNEIIKDQAMWYVYHNLNFIHMLNPMYQTYEMAKMLVRINGKYLEYIRQDLQNEKICIIAIKNDFRSIKFVMEELLTCEMIVLAICN
jgi:hypothetical protein